MPANKAFRTAMAAGITAKAASDPMELTDLFGAPKGAVEKKEKKVKKEPKELTKEQEEQKVFERNMTQCLACIYSEILKS